MSNSTAKTITTNIVPVQGTFEPLPPYECINLIGPAGTPFYVPVNPNLDGVNITNSTINSTTIGAITPSTAAFTTATGSNAPVGNLDLTNKVYVDSAIVGISWKQPVVAGTLSTNITLSGAQSIDGVSVVAGERVLVKNQTDQSQNGIYVAATGAWSRASDADTWDDLVSALVFIESGTQAGTAWYCPIQPGGTLGTTSITWSNFSIAGTYYAGTGLSLAANTFSITNTGVAAATYGSASTVPTIAVNSQGQITSATNTSIAIAASAITSGTIDSARISGSYSGITTVGTLSSLTVSSTITGSISGNAATATSATTAASATSLIGGATGSLPYQSSPGATTFLAAGSNGQVLTLASGVPSWSTPTTGTVTSVGTAGTVNGLTLTGGPITGSGTVTLGGTLDLSAPPTIGNTTANTIRGTTITATTGFVGTNFDAAGSGGGALRTSGGSNCLQWGGGGGVNVTIDGPINMNGANSAIQINPTGTGTVSIAPAGALTVNPTTASTMNNVAIGGTTPLAGTFTDLRFNNTLSLAGSTGTAGYVVTSNGASAPTWQALPATGLGIVDDTTTNATRYITFTDVTTGTITTENVSSTKLQFNPSTGILSSTGFAGALNGTVGATTANTGLFTTIGASGVATFSAGTASDPAITTTGDTNTGMFFPAADTIAFSEGGVEVARFNADAQFVAGAGTALLPVITTTGDVNTGIFFPAADTMAFSEGGAEVMRIESGGRFLVGTTSTSAFDAGMRANPTGSGGSMQVIISNTGGGLPFLLNTTADQNIIDFRRSSTNVGTISVSTTNTAYNTSSDYRLKENIAPMTGALAKVTQLKPCTYTWKANGSAGQGFIAHELQSVVPDSVTGVKDAVDEEGNPVHQGVDTSYLVATLTAAIQELNAKVEAQTAEIAELKAKP